MNKNMGSLDRIIRIALAVAVGVLYALGVISGTVALILGILAVVFLLTGVVSVCPIYSALRLSTRKKTRAT